MTREAPTAPNTEPAGSRSVRLDANTTLVVRAATAEDAAGLAALYDGLDDDDRYFRFFSRYHPPPEFYEQLARLGERGGYELVAAVSDTDGAPPRIVAEAGYAPSTSNPRDDPELAITVAREWRGWLGPFLLDALLEAAAARGVPNLRAEILLSNGPMLALVRARGYVTAEHGGWTSVSVRIGTEGCTPTWNAPEDGRRLLVEAPGGRWSGEERARADGLHVLVCPGPVGPGARCPALAGHACPLAAAADGIIVVSRPQDPQWAALPDAHADLHGTVPVAVQRHAADPEVAALLERLARRA